MTAFARFLKYWFNKVFNFEKFLIYVLPKFIDGVEIRSFYFMKVQKLFTKILTRSGKTHHMELNLDTSK